MLACLLYEHYKGQYLLKFVWMKEWLVQCLHPIAQHITTDCRTTGESGCEAHSVSKVWRDEGGSWMVISILRQECNMADCRIAKICAPEGLRRGRPKTKCRRKRDTLDMMESSTRSWGDVGQLWNPCNGEIVYLNWIPKVAPWRLAIGRNWRFRRKSPEGWWYPECGK